MANLHLPREAPEPAHSSYSTIPFHDLYFPKQQGLVRSLSSYRNLADPHGELLLTSPFGIDPPKRTIRAAKNPIRSPESAVLATCTLIKDPFRRT